MPTPSALIYRYRCRWSLLVLLVLLMGAMPQPAGPSPDLSPTDVVRLQLSALRSKDMQDGIRRAYRFASPDNRRMLGSVDDFAQILLRQYGDMLTQRDATVTLRQRSDDAAQVVAELKQPEGGPTAYLFLLTRQAKGECSGCWMTDGVIALEPADGQTFQSI